MEWGDGDIFQEANVAVCVGPVQVKYHGYPVSLGGQEKRSPQFPHCVNLSLS